VRGALLGPRSPSTGAVDASCATLARRLQDQGRGPSR